MMTIEKKFAAFAKSKFRSHFKLDPKDCAYIRERGAAAIQSHARDFIKKRLAPKDSPNDGKQTPLTGHPVFKAQHATATCCRGCLEKWHHIDHRHPLTPEEIQYVVGVILRWIEHQLKKEAGDIGTHSIIG